MAKKQKRNVASNRQTNLPRAAVSPAPAAGPRQAVSPAAPRSSYTQEFNPDYRLVIQDLKKIAVLAVTFISVLVVLSFFLR